MNKSAKIVITGGAGFIGSELGYELMKMGYDVHLVDDMSFGYKENLIIDGKQFAKFVECDIRSSEIYDIIDGAKCVFHFAGISSLPVCQENPNYAVDVNVAGTANVLEACRIHNVNKVIFASTSAIYENNNTYPFKESDNVNPLLIYSSSKYQAEMLCNSYNKCYNMDITIIRFFNVYGPKQDFKRKSPPFTSYVIKELINKRIPILHSTGEQKRDYVYIEDLIELCKLCMTNTNASQQIFNACSNNSISVNEMYKIIAKYLDSNIKPKYNSSTLFWNKYPKLYEGNNPIKNKILEDEVNKYTLGSYEKAKKLLGWVPKIDMASGLYKMTEYIKNNVKIYD